MPFAVKPNVVVPFAPSEPFHDRLVTVTAEPLVESWPLHSWVIDWPLASVHLTVQLVMAALPALTVTSPWNPPDHELTVW